MDAQARVRAMVDGHGDALRRVARRYSASGDDAEDALQRGLEIYVRRLGRVDPATELAWLKVVVKHEALALRKVRGGEQAEEVDLDARPAPDQRPLDELLADRERAGRVAEALRRIKPDEARAILLKADGLSYEEIGARMGWSYTKVNRCLAEGRKHFLEAFGEIEAGATCERVAPALAALAAGRAGTASLLELRPHLRNCSACRATVRSLHMRRRARVAALAPLPWLQRLPAAFDAAGGTQLAAAAATSGGGRLAALTAAAGLCLGGPAPCPPPAPEPRDVRKARAAAARVHEQPAAAIPADAPRVVARRGATSRPAVAAGDPRTAVPPRDEFAFELAGGDSRRRAGREGGDGGPRGGDVRGRARGGDDARGRARNGGDARGRPHAGAHEFMRPRQAAPVTRGFERAADPPGSSRRATTGVESGMAPEFGFE